MFRRMRFAATLALFLVVGDAEKIRVCLLMMARNEETLLRRHLPSWLPLLAPGGCLVGQIDDRSTDLTYAAFLDDGVLPLSDLPYERRHVYHYEFDGLGPARSLLLSEAWSHFGAGASHYFIADPDWKFSLAPQISGRSVREQLSRIVNHGADENILAFQIFDRNGASSRWLDWFVRAKPGLKFKYRWHEMLDLKPEEYTYQVMQGFTVTETEGGSESYHLEESGGSGTVARFEREIALLEKDFADPGGSTDTRVLYYLGVDHASVLQLLKQEATNTLLQAGALTAAEAFEQWRPSLASPSEYRAHWSEGVAYLRSRVWDLWGDVEGQQQQEGHREMAWAAALWLGRLLHELTPSRPSEATDKEALKAYDRCIAVDPERVECRLQKIRLNLRRAQSHSAMTLECWIEAEKALNMTMPERTFLQVPYHYTCTVVAVAAQAAVAAGKAEAARSLLSRAQRECARGLYDEAPDMLQRLEQDLLKLDEQQNHPFASSSSSSWSFSSSSSSSSSSSVRGTLAIKGTKPNSLSSSSSSSPLSSRSSSSSSSSSSSVRGIRAAATAAVGPHAKIANTPSSSSSSSSSPSSSASPHSAASAEAHLGGKHSQATTSLQPPSSFSSSAAASSSSSPPPSSVSDDTGDIIDEEIASAEREEAARWLNLAERRTRHSSPSSSDDLEAVSADVVKLVVRALEAQPTNSTVHHRAAAILLGGSSAGGAGERGGGGTCEHPPSGFGPAGVKRAGGSPEFDLAAAEESVARLLQKMARGNA